MAAATAIGSSPSGASAAGSASAARRRTNEATGSIGGGALGAGVLEGSPVSGAGASSGATCRAGAVIDGGVGSAASACSKSSRSALGAEDLELAALARIGLALEERLHLPRARPREQEREPEHGEIIRAHRERPLRIFARGAQHTCSLERAPEPHGGARRQIACRHEARVGAQRLAALAIEAREELREPLEERGVHGRAIGRVLQHVEILHGKERARRGRPPPAGLHLEHPREVRRIGEALGDEADVRDAIDEREQALARVLEDLGEVAVGGHQRALDRAAHHARALLQLAFVQEVQGRAEQHVASVEHLVEVRVHCAEHPLVGEVLGAAGLGERLEVDGADEIGLHRALGDLAREKAGHAAPLVDDAPYDGAREPTLGGPGRPGDQRVLAREQRHRGLIDHVLALEVEPAQLVEEEPEPLERDLEPLGVLVFDGGTHAAQVPTPPQWESSASDRLRYAIRSRIESSRRAVVGWRRIVVRERAHRVRGIMPTSSWPRAGSGHATSG